MTGQNTEEKGIRLTDEQKKRRSHRNLAIAGTLVALVLIFYLLTIFNFGPEILNRPL